MDCLVVCLVDGFVVIELVDCIDMVMIVGMGGFLICYIFE